MTENSYEKILQRKIDYYGETKAAYDFAAEEYAREQVKDKCSPLVEALEAVKSTLINGYDFDEDGSVVAMINKALNESDYQELVKIFSNPLPSISEGEITDEEIDKMSLLGRDQRFVDPMNRSGWIEGAKAIRDRLRPQPSQWVSVKERLPEKGEVVLVYCESQGVQMCYLNVSGKWLMHYDSSPAYLNIVKWMPVPKTK